MTKYAGDQTVLAVDWSGGTVPVTIAQVADIGGPSVARTSIDSTTRDDGRWRTHLKGMKDGGELTFTLMFDPSETTHGSTSGVLSDINNDGTAFAAFTMTFPDTSAWTFDGFVTGFDMGHPIDDNLTADVSVKIVGAPVFT